MYEIPKMLTGKALTDALTVLPEYDPIIRLKEPSERLVALSGIYKLYLPSAMSVEIYSKLYLSLIRSLQKKDTKEAVQQYYENHKNMSGNECRGIIGGADSFTIIGCSGIGKSSAISRSLSLLGGNKLLEATDHYGKVIPCLSVQCPFDSSVKGLLLEILRKIDEITGSGYYKYAVKTRIATTDMLIGTVSSVALNHIGILIVDEIQNVVNSKNGKNLVGMLTQLINNSGISIAMVGTPESASFFEKELQLARRSTGLYYGNLEYDDYFRDLCRTAFSYQYVKEQTDITPAITEWLYEHSNGIVSVVITLLHDAQETAILSGGEKLDLEVLNGVYKSRLSMLHSFIAPESKRKSTPRRITTKTATQTQAAVTEELTSIYEITSSAKKTDRDVIELLKQRIIIEEVQI